MHYAPADVIPLVRGKADDNSGFLFVGPHAQVNASYIYTFSSASVMQTGIKERG